MSYVSNVILTCSFMEAEADELVPDAMPRLNAWLTSNGHGEMKSVAEHAGGRKHFECFVYMVACNHLDIDSFVAAVRDLDWHAPDSLQLLILEQGDQVFRCHIGNATPLTEEREET